MPPVQGEGSHSEIATKKTHRKTYTRRIYPAMLQLALVLTDLLLNVGVKAVRVAVVKDPTPTA